VISITIEGSGCYDACLDVDSLMCELLWDCFQVEEIEEKKKETEGDDVEKKMEVEEDKPTPAPADQDSSSSQTQKSESASDGPEATAAPVTENAEVRSSGHLLYVSLLYMVELTGV
jgi:hypothetical protein